MGCGKSSVGKPLSEMSGYEFYDTDCEIVKDCGISISEMVGKYGWSFFRKKEKDILKKTTMLKSLIVATGGGIVLDDDNVSLMTKNSLVIWLRAPVRTIKKRLSKDTKNEDFRPSFSRKNTICELAEILCKREPLYKKSSRFSIDTDGKSVYEVCCICFNMMRTVTKKCIKQPPPAG